MLPVRIWNGTERQLDTQASLLNGECINSGGVMLLPEAKKKNLKKLMSRKRIFKQNRTVKSRNRENAAWDPDDVHLLTLVPLRGMVFPALGNHEGILHSSSSFLFF